VTVQTSQIADCVSRYAARLHALIGTSHHVASPLSAWLLLALVGPASTGPDRVALTEALGCDVDVAAQAAGELLASPHPLVASAAAVWTAGQVALADSFCRWQSALPAEVTTGALPDQAGLDAWAREHTFGLIDRFPVGRAADLYLVLATALATKVSWQIPFELAPAASLGAGGPWTSRLSQVLRTPTRPGQHAHEQFIAVTPEIGDVAVHIATASGGLVVVSVAALPDVPAGQVVAAAHRIGCRRAMGFDVARRALAELPLGEGPLWLLREQMASSDTCTAVLPAWSARSEHRLDDPLLGFAAAKHALAPGPDPWQAQQSAVARYSRTGFEAAAVTVLTVRAALQLPGTRRAAELRFAHPYAVVAVSTDPVAADRRGATSASPWRGLPVFSAWVSSPEDATDDQPEPAPDPST
jgi:hypothetical protein